jgi:predicted nuclease of restriction endonuclease-like (RecB) superfamily
MYEFAVQTISSEQGQEGIDEAGDERSRLSTHIDIFKDPVVMKFVGLPEWSRLVESQLEEELINNLQAFLLELGKGFARSG